jgi:hypothetical protein
MFLISSYQTIVAGVFILLGVLGESAFIAFTIFKNVHISFSNIYGKSVLVFYFLGMILMFVGKLYILFNNTGVIVLLVQLNIFLKVGSAPAGTIIGVVGNVLIFCTILAIRSANLHHWRKEQQSLLREQ